MTVLIVVALIAALLTWYALWGRGWLKSKPWSASFFAWIEPIEIFLFKKSETILFARLKIASGLMLSALTSLGAIDLTPLMPFVPEKYAGYVHVAFNLLPLIISFMGMIDEKLRNTVSKPLELVAVSDKEVAANPKVAEAIAMAESTKTEAVNVVAVAKAG